MNLQVVTIDEDGKWNDIVNSFKNCDVYYLNEYVKAFELHGDGEPLLFYFDNGDTRAVNVVMKRDIAKDKNFIGKIEENTYFDLSTPYGYGGFIIEGSNIKQLDEEYIKYCKDNNIVSEFVRFHPIINNARAVGKMYEVLKLGNTVCIDTSREDVIWNNLTSKNRNMIRKAKKSGVEIFYGRDEKLVEEFIDIYNVTMDKDNATSYYYFNEEFYLSILNDLCSNSLFFYAKLNDEIIAMSIIIFCNEKVHYHLSGSKREFQKLAPTNLLLYEVAYWASKKGIKSFHLGGGLGSKEDSLYKFKKAFNREEDREFCIGKKIFNRCIYNQLVNSSNECNKNTGFFPAYRE